MVRLVLVLLCLTSSVARAGSLHWQAAEGCPSAEAFAAMVTAAAADLGGLEVHAVATPTASGWHVHVEVRAGEQRLERDLDAASCEEAAQAAALVITLLAEDLAPVAPPSPVAPRPRPGRARDPEEPVRTPRVSMDLAAHGGAGVGTLPGTAPRFGVSIAAGFAELRAEVGVDLWPERTRRLGRGPGADIGLWTTVWRGCWAPGLLFACLGVELGELHAAGFGAPFTDTAREGWQAALLSLGGRWKPLPQLGISFAVELARPLQRAVFLVENEELFVVGAWSGRLSLSIETTIF